jgi:hypothetical protein
LFLDCRLLCNWIAICFVYGLPFALYLDCHLLSNGNPYTKQMAIQIQSKWQSIYKTNGYPVTKQTAIHIQRNSNPVTKQMAIWIVICFVFGLPFVLYLDCHLLCNWNAIKQMAIQLQNKWQSRYKANGNPYTTQMAIQLQNKRQSRNKTNSNPYTKQMAIHIQNKWQVYGLPFALYLDCPLFYIWIAICFISGLPFVL